MNSVGGQRGKICTEQSGGSRDDEAVEQTARNISLHCLSVGVVLERHIRIQPFCNEL